ncbi:MAG: pyruvate dehydrogenase (acetyl-transferring) E1 component subunit alpha [Antricoccus sp.]
MSSTSTHAPAATPMVQLLSPEGERVNHPDYPWDFNADEIRALYRDLFIVRRIDTEAMALQRQGEMGIWASCLGQEAAQVGSGRAMGPTDMAFPTYRETGVAWCRGVEPKHLTSGWRGIDYGSWDPLARGFNLYTVVLGSQTLHAVGYAMGMQRDNDDSAVVAYFGDGASSQGDVNEAFIFAASYDAPVVFFCQNNQWAISEPFSRQSRVPLYQRASGFGFPGIRVDGNDVLACLAVTRHALSECRSGNGPVLIEAFTFRMGAHTSNDDPTRYRLAVEVENWKLKDPLERVRSYLVREGLANKVYFDALSAEADQLATDLREHTLSLTVTNPADMFDWAYENQPEHVQQQREEFIKYRASFVEGDE